MDFPCPSSGPIHTILGPPSACSGPVNANSRTQELPNSIILVAGAARGSGQGALAKRRRYSGAYRYCGTSVAVRIVPLPSHPPLPPVSPLPHVTASPRHRVLPAAAAPPLHTNCEKNVAAGTLTGLLSLKQSRSTYSISMQT